MILNHKNDKTIKRCHKTTLVRAYRGFRLLPLASYNYNFTIFLLYPIMWVWSKGILNEKPIIAEGIRYMGENEKKEFHFINEQIKKKPFYRRKWFTQGAAAIALALIFGVAAGVMFAIVQPWASNQFGKPDEPTQIVMVQEETHTQETETGQTEQKVDDEKETAKGRKKNSKETDAIEEYRMHYDQMKNVVDSAENSLVKIKSYVAKMDWFSESYENVTETSGLVFRVDSNWLYILTSSRFIKSAQQITVTFPGGEVADAAVRQQDTVTELAILEIPLKSIKESTIQSISAISIKGISSVEKGESVIAVGSPMGYTDSINYGMITSITECEDVDGEYKVIATDMAASDTSYGFLLNLDGNMVGIVAQKFKQTGAADTLTALGISDISYLLEMLAAGRSLPYTGVVGKSVSAGVAEHFSVPYGIYVKKVNTDSPAMYAGIQAADVITEINGESVGSMSEYEDILRKYQEGDTLKIKVRRKSIGGYADVEMKLVMGAR